MTEQALQFATLFTVTGYWTVFFVVRMLWYSGVTLALRHSPLLVEMCARLPPRDPAAPFLAAYIRGGERGAADLAVYALLRRGAVRFVDGVVQVVQPAVTLPTLCEQCALQWAIANDRLRQDEQTYFQHAAFQRVQMLGAGDRLVRMQSGRTMQWQDAMWVGGVHGVPTVWSARIEMSGRDDQPIVTGPPVGWFDASMASTPQAWSDVSHADGGH